MMTSEELDKLAESLFDFVCSNRMDNKSKNPREVACEYKDLFENAKHHYRSAVLWALQREKTK